MRDLRFVLAAIASSGTDSVYGFLQPLLRGLPPPRSSLPPAPGFAMIQNEKPPEPMITPSACSPFGTWTVGNCNEQSKKFPDHQNFYSCLADGSYSPYQNCDELGENCQSCVYVDTGTIIPARAMPEDTRFCPTWYSEQENDPCREAPGEAFLCSPREWTRMVWTWDDRSNSCIKNPTGVCTSFRGLGFLTEKACNQRCHVDYFNDVCRLPVNKGCNCQEKKLPVTKFFYDKEENACKSFQYYGCGWNGNNFDTYADCLSRCKLETQDKIEIEVNSFNYGVQSSSRAPQGSVSRLRRLGTVKKVILPTWTKNYVKLIKIKRGDDLTLEEQMFVNYYKTEVEISDQGTILAPNAIDDYRDSQLKYGPPTTPVRGKVVKYESPRRNPSPPSGLNSLLDFHDGLMVVGSDMSVKNHVDQEISIMANAINARLANPTSIDRRQPPYCREPRFEGNGRMEIRRWYYNKKANRCFQFWYNGGGSLSMVGVNNFKTKQMCLDTCRIEL